MTPILGYSRWIVNADNKVTVYKDWKIDAILRMAYQNKLVSLQSLPDGRGKDGSVTGGDYRYRPEKIEPKYHRSYPI